MPAVVDAVPVTVWPNPAAAGEAVTIAGPVGAAVTVFDALGRVVWASVGTPARSTVVPAGLTPGLYVVQ